MDGVEKRWVVFISQYFSLCIIFLSTIPFLHTLNLIRGRGRREVMDGSNFSLGRAIDKQVVTYTTASIHITGLVPTVKLNG